jgi:hypothetical protein
MPLLLVFWLAALSGKLAWQPLKKLLGANPIKSLHLLQ